MPRRCTSRPSSTCIRAPRVAYNRRTAGRGKWMSYRASASATPSDVRTGMLIVWALALAKLVLHTVFNNQYGIFRDELGYLACGERLAFGYVDQPPLVPFLAELSRLVLGDSLRAVRFLPALASSLLVVQGALLAREFGAGR